MVKLDDVKTDYKIINNGKYKTNKANEQNMYTNKKGSY